jgi:hypothetical protein
MNSVVELEVNWLRKQTGKASRVLEWKVGLGWPHNCKEHLPVLFCSERFRVVSFNLESNAIQKKERFYN